MDTAKQLCAALEKEKKLAMCKYSGITERAGIPAHTFSIEKEGVSLTLCIDTRLIDGAPTEKYAIRAIKSELLNVIGNLETKIQELSE